MANLPEAVRRTICAAEDRTLSIFVQYLLQYNGGISRLLAQSLALIDYTSTESGSKRARSSSQVNAILPDQESASRKVLN